MFNNTNEDKMVAKAIAQLLDTFNRLLLLAEPLLKAAVDEAKVTLRRRAN